MNRYRKIFVTLIVLVVLFYAGRSMYYNFYFSQSNNSLALKIHFVESCGDCPPQWRVDKVISSDRKFEKLLNEDMFVFYRDKLLEKDLLHADWPCLLLEGSLKATGTLKETMSGKLKFIADKYYTDCKTK